MQINYTGRHLSVTDEKKEFIEKELQKKIKRYFDHIIQVDVIIEKEKNHIIVELKVKSKVDVFFAKESDPEFERAAALVTNKIEKEIQKKMDKIQKHH